MNDSAYIIPTKDKPVFTAVCSYSGVMDFWKYKDYLVAGSIVGVTFATNYLNALEHLHTYLVEECTRESLEGLAPDVTFQIFRVTGTTNRWGEVVKKSVYKLTVKQILELLF